MHGQILIEQFIESINDSRRIYIDRSIESTLSRPAAAQASTTSDIEDIEARFNRLMIKIFVEVAWTDFIWTPGETEVAKALLEELFREPCSNKQLKKTLTSLVEVAQHDSWQKLFEPFTAIEELAPFRPELESALMRIANIVAKVDGRVTEETLGQLKNTQWQLHQFLSPAPDSARAAGFDYSIYNSFDPEAGRKQAATKAKEDRKSSSASVSTSANDSSGAAEPSVQKAAASAEELEEVLAELDSLIGLDSIKKEVRGLVNFLKVQQHRRDAGLPDNQIGLHLVFEGNPGTGKTTVARLLGRVFGAMGILKSGHLVETDRSGLVAEFAGQTAVKTNKLIDEALDGVLFIDEAYSLISEDGKDPFGPEAIQTLLKRAEDDRKRLIVILAGYSQPMQRMLKSNAGLSSRFNRQFLFNDFEADDLLKIFERMSQASHYVSSPEVEQKLLTVIGTAIASKDEHFGNGRLVRNIFENAMRRLADRVVNEKELTPELLTTFVESDIVLD